MATAENSQNSINIAADEGVGVGSKPKAQKDGQYSDPLYKKLSKMNGEINKLKKDELKEKLKEMGLDSRGVKEVLRKRLKNYYKRRKLMKARIRPPGGTKYDYLAVIDFEATCEEHNIGYRHEIIEFPIILVDVEKKEIVEQFHEFVKPMVNRKLTAFCTQLTGITQETVDAADQFHEVLGRVEDWLSLHKLGSDKSFAVLTDGPWDMFRFMYYQCKESGLEMPVWSKKWVNVRKSYCNFYQCGRGGIETMLTNLGMKFEGTPHSGLDDATNIARIAIKMLGDGCALNINEHIQIIDNPFDSKREVRYEPLKDSEDESEEPVDDSAPSNRSANRNAANIPKEKSVCKEFGAMSLNNTIEHTDENVSDLLSYYKLQKS